jgi:translocation and assembly module TamB
MDLGLRASQLPLATLARLAGSDLGVRGLLDADFRATGTRAAPRLESTLRLSDVAATGARGYRLEGTAGYADLLATVDLRVLGAGGPIGTVQFGLPMDLAFEPRASRRPGDGALRGRLEAQGTPLAVLEAFTTAVTDARGTVDATVDLTGTWDAPRLRGALVASASRVGVPALGRITLQDVEAAVRFLGDTIQVQRLEMTSRSGGRLSRATRAGRLRGDGTVTFTDIADPRFDLSLSTDNFNAVARPRLADLDLSGSLRLTGPASRAELAGALTVNRGTLTIPDLTNKDVIDVADPDFVRVVDTALFSRARLLPSRPSRLVSNLAVNDVRIAMGTDVWLRSAEANINLGGEVRVGRRRVAAGADTARAILSLDGTLLVNRGTYRLNVADVVQRTFDVEQGRIVFSPVDPTFNPGLDIAAVHTVRNFNSTLVQQDRKIRVRIGGTLQQPTLRFESADNAQLSQSDLISYLITGAPAFGVGDPTETAGAASTAANVLLASLSSVLADRIAALGYLDYVQIQTAGLDRGLQAAGAAPVDPAQQILSLTRIGGGVQLSDRLFLSGDAGLCPFVQPSANASVWNQLGVRLEYRLSSAFTASAGVEPPTQSLLCGAANVRGFVLTPQQIGLDLTSAWRF